MPQLSHTIRASKTFDFASIAAGAVHAVTTVTVPGAALGDVARAAIAVANTGVQLDAWVSAANTVSVLARNPTAGAIDLASAKLNIIVEKF